MIGWPMSNPLINIRWAALLFIFRPSKKNIADKNWLGKNEQTMSNRRRRNAPVCHEEDGESPEVEGVEQFVAENSGDEIAEGGDVDDDAEDEEEDEEEDDDDGDESSSSSSEEEVTVDPTPFLHSFVDKIFAGAEAEPKMVQAELDSESLTSLWRFSMSRLPEGPLSRALAADFEHHAALFCELYQEKRQALCASLPRYQPQSAHLHRDTPRPQKARPSRYATAAATTVAAAESSAEKRLPGADKGPEGLPFCLLADDGVDSFFRHLEGLPKRRGPKVQEERWELARTLLLLGPAEGARVQEALAQAFDEGASGQRLVEALRQIATLTLSARCGQVAVLLRAFERLAAQLPAAGEDGSPAAGSVVQACLALFHSLHGIEWRPLQKADADALASLLTVLIPLLAALEPLCELRTAPSIVQLSKDAPASLLRGMSAAASNSPSVRQSSLWAVLVTRAYHHLHPRQFIPHDLRRNPDQLFQLLEKS